MLGVVGPASLGGKNEEIGNEHLLRLTQAGKRTPEKCNRDTQGKAEQLPYPQARAQLPFLSSFQIICSTTQ